MQDIAAATGFPYEELVSGPYKLLLEPMVYVRYHDIMYAMTATEAALYNKKVSGLSLIHILLSRCFQVHHRGDVQRQDHPHVMDFRAGPL